MSNESAGVRAAWQMDLGAGRQIEVDVDASGRLWAAVGHGTSQTEVWIKQVTGNSDLRITVHRIAGGISLAVGRALSDDPNVPGGPAARLDIRVDEAGIVSVLATIGQTMVTADPGSEH